MNLSFTGHLELSVQGLPVEFTLAVKFDADEDGPVITDCVLEGQDIVDLLTDSQLADLVSQAMDAEQRESERVQSMLEDRDDEYRLMREERE